ncbi:hypothetical protein GCM10017788_78720 [Amycolatopsis acidiphila]|nr:hypothetical protein GCM10017788_78720 [Amycolatopsis acidiphila]
MRCLLADRESLTVQLRFPRGHWQRIRHSNFIERAGSPCDPGPDCGYYRTCAARTTDTQQPRPPQPDTTDHEQAAETVDPVA